MHRFQFALIIAALVAGCGDEPKPKSATDVNTKPAQAAPKKDTATPTSGSVHIDEKITKACGDLPTAHFAFDSAEVAADAAAALDALARCFVSKSGAAIKLLSVLGF